MTDQERLGELAERARELYDLDELRRLAALGSTDALDILVEEAGDRGDLDELRRLAAAGSKDAAAVLADLTD